MIDIHELSEEDIKLRYIGMENKGLTNTNDAAYQKLIDNITTLWGEAKSKAIAAVNTELLDANWQTGKYIVEFEQGGKQRAEYGKRLLVNLAKDLTARNGKGFNRTNLTYMRKLYLAFPKCGTLSHKLTWSHYYELLKCDNALEMQFYYKESIKECWKVRELKRQMKSCLFQRLALSTDKAGVLALANEGHQVQTPQDIIRDPFILEFAGLPKQKRYKESDLEKALKDHMEQFLLEMGRGFAFVGRQYAMQIGSRQIKVDLVFYHCILSEQQNNTFHTTHKKKVLATHDRKHLFLCICGNQQLVAEHQSVVVGIDGYGLLP